jgi:hypothetical protein
VQGDVAAGTLLRRVDLAGVEGSGVDVEADSALVPLAGIEDRMNRLAGIDGAGIGGIDLDEIGGLDVAAVIVEVLGDDSVILHHELTDRCRHPTVLVAMIVDGADLADVPTNGHQFECLRLVDEVAGIVLAVPEEIRGKTIRVDGTGTQDLTDTVDVGEGALGESFKLLDELLDRNFA